MNRRLVPSMAALLAFDAVARYQSITLAADELSRTQSAVSRQITLLEDRLGIQLFFRERNSLALSQQGKLYAKRIHTILEDIADHTASVVASGSENVVLHVAVLPTFCSHWLVPRMSKFYKKHPNLEVNFLSETRPFNFKDSGADIAVHYGQHIWPGAVVKLLLTEIMVVVCSPELLASARVTTPLDLEQCRMLQLTTRPDAWQWWLDSIDQEMKHPMVGPQFELFSHVIAAAIAGLGFAILPKFLIKSELDAGTLMAPFPNDTADYGCYYVVCPYDKADNPPVQAFCNWLQTEAYQFARACDLS